MKHIRPILFLTLLLLYYGCTQAQTHNIVKAQAYYRQRIAGNIPVDESGGATAKGVHRDYLLYVETTGHTLPEWQTAYINGLPYTVKAVEVQQTPLSLGTLKGKNTTVTLHKKKGNRLWQLMITAEPSTTAATTGTQPGVMLSGQWRGKAITYRINNLQELAKQFNP